MKKTEINKQTGETRKTKQNKTYKSEVVGLSMIK